MGNFSQELLTWYDDHGRHDLPWQQEKTPYRVWVSEIMLQQTQVQTVIPYYERFMNRFSSLSDLARADLDDVLAHWAGLGYYSRARNLHKSAIQCCDEHGGELPGDFDALLNLPGIGRSTAGAILSIAFGLRYPILDGNVKRVLARYHGIKGWTGEKTVLDQLWIHADAHTPETRVGEYTQAIMDLGATLCSRRQPQCDACVHRKSCQAAIAGIQHEIPAPRPKKTTPMRECWMLVARNDSGSVWLERRAPTGIWGGLWSLPEFSTRELLEQHVSDEWLNAKMAMPHGKPFKHSFTHFKLVIHPILLREANPRDRKVQDQPRRWVSAKQSEKLGLPQPVRRFLNKAFENNISWQEQLELPGQ